MSPTNQPETGPRLPPPQSPGATPFRLQPISASVLAESEKRRRDEVQKLGCCRLGCSELDDEVLLGGLERGCVVGASAEEEDYIGVPFGLQLLVHSLLKNPRHVRNAMIITPKPQGIILRALRDVAEAELRSQGVAPQERQESMRQVLDRVTLSCVFEFDELWAVLADIDRPTTPFDEAMQPEDKNVPTGQRRPPVDEGDRAASEIGDSQEEDESLTPPSPERSHTPRRPAVKALPDIILITHFSAILTSLFTSRDKQSAHAVLRLASSHLRHLSRALPSHPLVLILNSTTAESDQRSDSIQTRKPLDPTLRSIFNPAPLPLPGYTYPATAKRNKPSFGMVFSQMLDLHLLLTRIPKSKEDADLLHAAPHEGAGNDGRARATGTARGAGEAQPRFVTAVEVLLDEIGVWHGGLGTRRDREQRWGILDFRDGRLVDGVEKKEAADKPARLSAGFGGRRH